MNQELKALERKQYFKYFTVWFIVTGTIVAACILIMAVKAIGSRRANDSAPSERVYDMADVLTEEEEDKLREYITRKEKFGTLDIIIVTLNQPMGVEDTEWEHNMMNYADDFYDAGAFGWNRPYGDGICLLDNWYEDENGSQKGSWLSTSGKMVDTIGWYEEDMVFDAMEEYIDTNPYEAYRAAVDELADYGKYGYEGDGLSDGITGFFGSLIVSFVVAAIYAVCNLSQTKAKDTTVAGTYVENGKMKILARSDAFTRKSVSSHRISSNSSGGGGGSSHHGGGSSGSHHSSGGHSHGGGGRRR